MTQQPHVARALIPVLALLVIGCARAVSLPSAQAAVFTPRVIIVTPAAAPQIVAALSASKAATRGASGPAQVARASATVPATVSAPVTATSAPAPAIAPAQAAATQPPRYKLVAASAAQARIEGVAHQQQTWNNCGPANIAMLLGALGTPINQAEAARSLKPVREDKNVSPDEMVAFAIARGYHARWVRGADLDLIRAFLISGIPVIAESWYVPHPNDEMGHYELVTAFDDAAFTVDDSYLGANSRVALADFDGLWRVFNRSLIVVWTDAQAETVAALLGERQDETRMLRLALASARQDAERDPNDKFAWFNIGTNLLELGDAAGATTAFAKADTLKLPWRMLWYQHGPLRANFEAGLYPQVIALADRALKATGDLEESYYWRGQAFRALGKQFEAKRDFSIALKLNPNYKAAEQALALVR